MNPVDLLLHLDKHLEWVVKAYGWWTYPIVTTVIFCETGLVVAPILPGDSLLFLAGMIAARPEGELNVAWLLILLAAAAVLGDTVNYWIGHLVGPKVFHKENVRLLNRKHLLRAHEFYVKYGGVTIIMARFMPIIRTFAPFVAGIGSMTYWKFLTYNVVGGVVWVTLLLFLGYFIGNIPSVKEHLSVVTAIIVFLSILPGIVEFLRHRRKAEVEA
jgi:membrane-associated protein